MVIQNNIAGFNASRNKGITEGKMRKSLEKLSSGYRINRAGDDAAGLAISEWMRNQITALDQAMRNVNDGISMTSTGDGALTEVHAMLERMKTLAIQSANGTYTTLARENLDAERMQLLDEIDRIGEMSDFDEIPLFDSAKEKPNGAPFVPPEQKDEITLQIGASVKETLDVPRYYMSSNALLLNETDFTSLDAANESVTIIDNAIEAVADIRADFGAAQNHLEHTHNNLSVTSENMTAAESQIRDTNVAEEFTLYTKDNIVYQSSNSMVAQANSIPGMILQLLQ
ncbi:flagellin [Clostridiaceae bacterium]|nr:flagellin [Clostridiaceae bacterium]RKI11646.1 flagellin [bacterium 1XD21-70]